MVITAGGRRPYSGPKTRPTWGPDNEKGPDLGPLGWRDQDSNLGSQLRRQIYSWREGIYGIHYVRLLDHNLHL